MLAAGWLRHCDTATLAKSTANVAAALADGYMLLQRFPIVRVVLSMACVVRSALWQYVSTMMMMVVFSDFVSCFVWLSVTVSSARGAFI